MKTKNKKGVALLWIIIILILVGAGFLVWWLTKGGSGGIPSPPALPA